MAQSDGTAVYVDFLLRDTQFPGKQQIISFIRIKKKKFQKNHKPIKYSGCIISDAKQAKKWLPNLNELIDYK
jgi:hypothetical protein